MVKPRRAGLDFAALHARLQAAPQEGGLSPEQARALLEERARELAQRPAQGTGAVPLELLCFKLAGERYAIESRHVKLPFTDEG